MGPNRNSMRWTSLLLAMALACLSHAVCCGMQKGRTGPAIRKLTKLNAELDRISAAQKELSARFQSLDERKATLEKVWQDKRQRLSKQFSSRVKQLDMKKLGSSTITALASVGIELVSQTSLTNSGVGPQQSKTSAPPSVDSLYQELAEQNTQLTAIINQIQDTKQQMNAEAQDIEQLVNQIQGLEEANGSKRRIWERKLEELDLLTRLVYANPETQTQTLNQLSEQELRYGEKIDHELGLLTNTTLQVSNKIGIIDQEEQARKNFIRSYLANDSFLNTTLNLSGQQQPVAAPANATKPEGFSLTGLFGKIFGQSSDSAAVQPHNSSAVQPPANASTVPGAQTPKAVAPPITTTAPRVLVVTQTPDHPKPSPVESSSPANTTLPAQSTTVVIPPTVDGQPGSAVVIIHNHQTTINVLPPTAATATDRTASERVFKVQPVLLHGARPLPVV